MLLIFFIVLFTGLTIVVTVMLNFISSVVLYVLLLFIYIFLNTEVFISFTYIYTCALL